MTEQEYQRTTTFATGGSSVGNKPCGDDAAVVSCSPSMRSRLSRAGWSFESKTWVFLFASVGAILFCFLSRPAYAISDAGDVGVKSQEAAAAGTAAAETAAKQPGATASTVAQARNQATDAALSTTPSDDPCSGLGGVILPTGKQVVCEVQNVIALLLGQIVKFLGKILLFFFDIFITFATYNKFSSSTPVQVGWQLVRDVVNMFFIVVLLVSAFGTIIGYPEDFHVKKVLPKLLLMAVVINFSRTLIQLLIDFSQVVMLTFAEAFQQSAGSDFVTAFQMAKLTKFNANTSSAANLAEAIIAYLLAMIFLIVACGTVLLLIIYVLGRILGLWIALIFSPIAFFASALPSKLANALGSFTKDYWGRLSGLLVGGPVVMFMMWLALATVHNTASEGLGAGVDLYNHDQIAQQDAAQKSGLAGFLTEIGTADSVAAFIIAVAMMMLALDTATKSASAAAPFAEGLIKGIKGKTLSAAKFVGASPLALGAASARAIDRRVPGGGVTGLTAAGLQKTVGRIPGVRALTRAPLAKLAGVQKSRQEKEAKSIMEGTDKMSYEQLQRHLISIPTSMLSSKSEKQAYAELQKKLGSEEMRTKRTKELSGNNEEALKKEFKTVNGRDANAKEQAEIKRQASDMALKKVAEDSAKHLAQAAEQAKSAGAKDILGEIGKELDKNPHLAASGVKLDEAMAKIRIDPDKMKNLSAEALSRADVLSRLLPEGAVKRNPTTGQVTGFDQAQLDTFYAQNKDNRVLTGNMKAWTRLVNDTPAGGKNDAEVFLQKGDRGEVLAYDGEGTRVRSGKENDALRDLNTEITVKGTKGRAAVDELDAGAQTAVATGLGSGMRLGDLTRQYGQDAAGTKDMAVETFARGRVFGSMQAAADAFQKDSAGVPILDADGKGRTDKAKLDVAIKDMVTIAPQLEELDSASQMKILEGADAGGAMDLIDHHWDAMDKNQKEASAKLVKVAMARGAEVAKKRASGAAVTDPGEIAAERLAIRAKEKFLARAKRDGAGKVIQERGPEMLVRIVDSVETET